MKTEQRSIRLSRYHLTIVEDLQEKEGLTFTDALKKILDEYSGFKSSENGMNRFLQKLENKLREFHHSDAGGMSPNYDGLVLNGQEILEELENMNGNMSLMMQAVRIIGSSDPRTLVKINALFDREINSEKI